MRRLIVGIGCSTVDVLWRMNQALMVICIFFFVSVTRMLELKSSVPAVTLNSVEIHCTVVGLLVKNQNSVDILVKQ